MAGAKKQYEVTVTRTGTIRVFADSPDAAMSVADAQDAAFVRWDDGFSPTDAREIEDDEYMWNTDAVRPDVVGAWHPGDIAWFRWQDTVACGRVRQVSVRPGFDGVADLAILSTDGPAVTGTFPLSCGVLFRTKDALMAAMARTDGKKEEP